MHLLAHTIYPATLLLALLALPAIWVRRDLHQSGWLVADIALAAIVMVSTRIFYRRAARNAGTAIPGVRDFPYLVLTGVALAISNTRAVCAGLLGKRTQFIRTPKFAEAAARLRLDYAVRSGSLLRLLESGMAVYLLTGACITAASGMMITAPMLSFLALAFGITATRG